VRNRPTILYHGPAGSTAPDLVCRWAEGRDFPVQVVPDAEAVESILLRGHPALLFVAGEKGAAPGAEDLVRRVKSDAFTAIIPVLVLTDLHDAEDTARWFALGADEVLSGLFALSEQRARMDTLVGRAVRDVGVHPSTRLPGTNEIERAIRGRIDGGTEFAVCYADLDHFKEFNDRYGYYEGDRVIFIVSRILHDVVRGLTGTEGFVGHIGGDDFIFMVPASEVEPVCAEILHVFDSLVPFQYNEQDRRAGYYFGKDRRGQLHRVPLMTLSIGIVTSRQRVFAHTAEVSELATEMKSYAKTLPGSVFVVDRRQGRDADLPGSSR